MYWKLLCALQFSWESWYVITNMCRILRFSIETCSTLDPWCAITTKLSAANWRCYSAISKSCSRDSWCAITALGRQPLQGSARADRDNDPLHQQQQQVTYCGERTVCNSMPSNSLELTTAITARPVLCTKHLATDFHSFLKQMLSGVLCTLVCSSLSVKKCSVQLN